MATVFQRCKSDPKAAAYPCVKPRCGHSWTVRYREPGGRTARQREKTFAKKTGPGGADVFAARVETDKDDGLYVDPNAGKITVGAYAEDWLARRIIAESTYVNYKGFIDNHLMPMLGHRSIAGVAKRDIEHFQVAIGKELAASTVHDRMKMVKHIFASAKEEKRIREDPARDVKNAAGSQAVDEAEIPTLPEVRRLHECMPQRYKLTVWLQAGAGLRVSEALAFHVGCLRRDVIRVRWQVSRRAYREDCKARLVPLKHREEGEYREVPAAPFLCAEIDAHVQVWAPIPLTFQNAVGKTRQVEVFFAPREPGREVMPTANTYGHYFKRACVAAGLVDAEGRPRYHPHSLRHFFASTALAAGIPIHEVSRWLGHKSIKTTVDIYGHLVPESWDRCRGIMQSALAEAT
ncbi:site-specific integrase [Streptomyces sp. SID13666]|uniref:tyrosine-type recombinase/integrase n=1 Tax=unclassified Streptomyces TaxID=2593676 RepID=UPI0013C00F8C|nr:MULTISPECIES: site-specific integrase [unclassified Streptomyces]NEA56215.1 site-specific integrase [Streptomyces sp. SID13666]NEA71886.1 site-specific integrase [Streptomyces sp. SID13588]